MGVDVHELWGALPGRGRHTRPGQGNRQHRACKRGLRKQPLQNPRRWGPGRMARQAQALATALGHSDRRGVEYSLHDTADHELARCPLVALAIECGAVRLLLSGGLRRSEGEGEAAKDNR